MRRLCQDLRNRRMGTKRRTSSALDRPNEGIRSLPRDGAPTRSNCEMFVDAFDCGDIERAGKDPGGGGA